MICLASCLSTLLIGGVIGAVGGVLITYAREDFADKDAPR
jgi:hypothetical protein